MMLEDIHPELRRYYRNLGIARLGFALYVALGPWLLFLIRPMVQDGMSLGEIADALHEHPGILCYILAVQAVFLLLYGLSRSRFRQIRVRLSRASVAMVTTTPIPVQVHAWRDHTGQHAFYRLAIRRAAETPETPPCDYAADIMVGSGKATLRGLHETAEAYADPVTGELLIARTSIGLVLLRAQPDTSTMTLPPPPRALSWAVWLTLVTGMGGLPMFGMVVGVGSMVDMVRHHGVETLMGAWLLLPGAFLVAAAGYAYLGHRVLWYLRQGNFGCATVVASEDIVRSRMGRKVRLHLRIVGVDGEIVETTVDERSSSDYWRRDSGTPTLYDPTGKHRPYPLRLLCILFQVHEDGRITANPFFAGCAVVGLAMGVAFLIHIAIG